MSRNIVKKVGIDISFARLNRAGLGTYVRGLLEGFNQVYHPYELSYFDVGQERDDIKRKTLRTRANTLYRDLIWLNLVLPAQAKRKGVDMLHMPAFCAPIFKPSPTVVTIHDMVWFDHPEYFPVWQRSYMRFFVPQAAHNADAVIADSECTRQDIISKLRIPSHKVHVTHLGVSKSFSILPTIDIQRIKQKYEVEKYIFVVGSVEPRKNLERLLTAFAELRGKYPDIILIHAGTSKWKSSDVFSIVVNKGLTGSVRFLWNLPQEDLIALYNGALFFIFPSLYEGFGLPIVEAMACGCPVITSNISSLPEVAGKAALMINPYDIGQIKQAMETLYQDDKKRHDLSQKGLEHASFFSWEKCARETIAVYREILGDP
jgi:glycosyltransferase involved in cell wall biosynthesis